MERVGFMNKIFSSAFMGILSLLIVNLTGFITGVSLGINYISLAVSAVLGIPGVITMIFLGYIVT